MRISGSEACSKTWQLCDWLTRMGEDFEWSEAEPDDVTPVLEVDSHRVANANIEVAAELLQYPRKARQTSYDVVIIGGGPAGLSAAIHAAAEGLQALTLEAYAWGGQMSSSMAIENYAGVERIAGDVLARRMWEQAVEMGAELLAYRSAKHLNQAGSGWKVKLDSGQEVYADWVITATGRQFKLLPNNYHNVGVHNGITSRDVKLCQQQAVVVGGANSAGQAALALAEHVPVYLVSKLADLSPMSEYLRRRIALSDKIKVRLGTEVKGFEGREDRLEAVDLSNGERIECGRVFCFLGTEKANTNFLPTHAWRDNGGQIITFDDGGNEYTIAGLFDSHSALAIGDARSGAISRVAVATADGARAIAHILTATRGQGK